MDLSQITPEMIYAGVTAGTTGLGGLMTILWKIARKTERKSIFNGDEGQYERRNNSTIKSDYLQCRARKR
jgi:hypothetical protein